ncbi:DNA internalization-related competence protein ComEC/Rec2 [Pseudomonas sp.]|uniref:DNA internalization-related competence protein ComEC/Rec2 n=1 Tax=Pseudomonas sp. TaxID=306 RepID=UPI0028B05EF5|nr:DNA internalization-related competence protein ComEC/Rec2 [Pseudomonas sp.]
MRAALLALAAGVLLLRLVPLLPPFALLPWLLVGGLLLLASRLRLLGCLLCGFAWACLCGHWALEDRLPEALDGGTYWLEGTVTGLPEANNGIVRFELDHIRSRHAGLPSRVRLAWYDGPSVRSGERWRLAAKLKRPRGLVNPGAFDYEAWLLAHRIGATGTVKAGERTASAQGLQTWRDQLRQRLVGLDAQGRSGTIAALVVGDASGLSSPDWRILQATGTVHLMVISGQHVGILAGLLYALVAQLARWGAWPRRVPWLPAACGLAFTGALGYGLLAGFDVPVQRAVVMVALVLLWRLRFRHLGVALPLLLALDAVLLIDPLVVLRSGFWLSFLAVAVLALTFRGRLGRWRWWQTLPRAQWSMTLGLLPALLALGLPLSISGPIANLIAVPLVGAIVVPLSLLGTSLLWFPTLGESLLWLAGGLLALLFDALQWIAAWQPSWLPAALPIWGWASVAIGVLLLLLPAGVPVRLLGLVLLLPLGFPLPARIASGEADVWVLDVGQGLAVLVRTEGHTLLYDAGPRYGDFDMGERVVYPALRTLGLSSLDLMILSHADTDHAGGAPAIQQRMPVRRVLSGEPDALPASLGAEACRSGRHWEWEGVGFTLWRWPQAQTGNQSSCVLLVEAKGERLLLTGDIDVAAEQALVATGLPRQLRWLLVPHHGSRSSSSEALIAAADPYAALVSRGLHNAFGHPHPDVVARLQAQGTRIHDTAEEGALRIALGRFEPARGLREEPRFWREK